MRHTAQLLPKIGLGSGVVAALVVVILVATPSVQAAAGINDTINFQGKVVNSDGTNVADGTYDFVIRIYNGAGNGATNQFTESWTSSALFSSTMSTAPTTSDDTLIYSSNTNESTLKVGQILWNTTKEESVVITSVDTSTNTLGISRTIQNWAVSDTITNRIYVKDGVFRVAINSLNQNWDQVNFNTDSLYVGVNFNSDGEMKPRIPFRSSVYAQNAKKVNGLTVTNTSDNPFSSTTTLKIGDGKTVVINNGLTFSGTDGTTVTFPNANDTVVMLDVVQTLTNKTIGSTGLTFSGATTDITTGTNENFVLNPNGTGKIGFGTTNPFGFFDVVSDLGTAPAASISATSSFASLIVDNAGLGDVFSASTSGMSRFTVKQDGRLQLASSIYNAACTALETDANGYIVCGTDGGGAGQWSDGTGGIYYNAGNVGIGTTDPSLYKLFVNGTGNSKALSVINGDGNQALFTASVSGATRFVISSNGNVGIGTTTFLNSSKLAIDNPVGNAAYFSSSGSAGLSIDNDSGSITTAYGVDVDVWDSGLSTSQNSLVGGEFIANKYSNTQATTVVAGVVGTGLYGGNANVTRLYGGLFQARHDGGGNVTDAYGVRAMVTHPSQAGINFAGYGVYIDDVVASIQYSLYSAGTNDTAYFAGRIGVGTTAPENSLSIQGSVGTTAIASVSGSTSFAALAVSNRIGAGDLFTASASGATRFTIANNGNIAATGSLTGLTGLTLASGPITLGGSTGSGQCLLGGANASWGACGSGGSSNWTLNTANGTLSPNNNTLDLLIGGTATSSAKFAVLNMTGAGTPTASISAVGSGTGLALNGNGNIQSLNMGPLSFGGSTTGQINFIPNGTSAPALTLTDSENYFRDPYSGLAHGMTTLAPTDAYLGIGKFGTGGAFLTGYAGDQFDAGFTIKGISNAPSSTTPAIDLYGLKKNGTGTQSLAATDILLNVRSGGNYLTVLGSGNVGIGTTAPVGKLNIVGTANQKALVQISGDGTQDLFTASVSGTASFVISKTGNVGIGTSGPIYPLHVSASSSGILREAQGGNALTGSTGHATYYGTTTQASLFGSVGYVEKWGAGLITNARGLQGYVNNQTVGDITNAYGASLSVGNFSSGAITNAYGASIGISSNVGGTITNGYGVHIASAVNLGTFTNNYGLYIQDQSSVGSTNSFNLYSAGATAKNYFAGYVGVGTTSPLAKLHVSGGNDPVATISATSAFAGLVVDQAGSGDVLTASTAGQNRFTVKRDGTIQFSGLKYGSSCTALETDASGNVVCGTDDAGSSLFTADGGGTFTYLTDTADDLVLGATTVGAAAFHLDITDGAGTPSTTLSLGTDGSKNGVLRLFSSTSGKAGTITMDSSGNMTLAAVAGSSVIVGSGTGDISLEPGSDDIVANLASTGDFLIQDNGTTYAIFDDSGRFGLGTTSPVHKFQITGTGNQKALAAINGDGNQELFVASASGVTKFIINKNGNVGIGVSNPGAIFHVEKTTAGVSVLNNLVNPSDDGAAAAAIDLAVGTGAPTAWRIQGSQTLFQIGDALTTTALNINTNGNLGIGNTAPLARLDVNGSASVSGNLSLYGAARSIQTTSGHTLTIGGGGTGDLVLDSGGNIRFADLGTCTALETISGLLTCGTDDTGGVGGGSNWTLNTTTGVLSPNNNTLDVLFGGTATSSAKFAFLNMFGAGTPTASVSAGTAALRLLGDGSIQSVRNNTLTVGGDTTGNILLMPQNGSGYVAIGAGAGTLKGNDNLIRPGAASAFLNLKGGSGKAAIGIANETVTLYSGNSAGYIAFNNDATNSTNGGTEAMRIMGGNVGIGTTAPLNTLDIRGNVGTTAIASVSGNTSFAALAVNNFIGAGDLFTASASGATRFVVKNNGNVGIGTAAPAKLLDIAGTGVSGALAEADLRVSGSGGIGAGIQFTPTGVGADEWTIFATNASAGVGAGNLAFWNKTDVAYRMILNTNGYLGIGTTSPASRLHVANNLGVASGKALLVLDQYETNGDLFTASASGATRFVVKNNGNVGINASNPTTALYLGGSSNTIGFEGHAIIAAGASQNLTLQSGLDFTINVGAGNSEFGVQGDGDVTLDGQLGVGTSAPVGKLHVNGARTGQALVQLNETGNQAIFTASASGTTRFVIQNDGNVGIGNIATGYPVPLAALQVGGSSAAFVPANARIIFSADFTNVSTGMPSYVGNWNSSNYWGIGAASGSSTDNTLRIGNVGKSGQTPNGWATTQNMSLMLNGTVGNSARAALDVGVVSATLPVASFSGQTNFAGLVIDQSGNGDIFTASRSGQMRFTVKQDGTIQFSSLKYGSSCTALETDASGNLVCGTDAGAGTVVTELLGETTLGGASSTLNVTLSAAREYVSCTIAGPAPSGTGTIEMRFDSDSGAAAYGWTQGGQLAGANLADTQDASDDAIQLTGTNTPNTDFIFKIYFSNVSGQVKTVQWDGTVGKTVGTTVDWYQGSANYYTTAGQVDTSVNFIRSANNFAAGTHAWCEGKDVADYAENYFTKDKTVQAADVVTSDPTLPAGIKKATKPYDPQLIGAISTKPAITLDDGIGFSQGKPMPVALMGRIPVKVSTINGPIKAGDLLTSSTIPGVAMKATRAGAVIGQAMEGFDGEGVGKVMTFVKTTYFTGTTLSDVASTEQVASLSVLERFMNQRDSMQGLDTSALSEIVTDRVAAGLEVITPKVVAHEVLLDKIGSATGSDVVLQLTADGEFVVKNNDGLDTIRFDSNGNGYFAGTLVADKIKANQIEGLEFRIREQLLSSDELAALFEKASEDTKEAGSTGVLGITDSGSESSESAELETLLTETDKLLAISGTSESASVKGLEVTAHATIEQDIRVKGGGIIEGVLNVIGALTTRDLFTTGLATFFGDVIFKGSVSFESTPVFTQDTAGYVTVEKGKNSADVTFTTEYKDVPVINVMVVAEPLTDEQFNSLIEKEQCDKDDREACQDMLDAKLLETNIRYLVTKKSTKGFRIRLYKDAAQDYSFSWTALAVKPVDRKKDEELDRKAEELLRSLLSRQ